MKKGKALAEEISQYAVKTGTAAFWWLGQHSFIVRTADGICCFDPFLTKIPGRRVPPLLRPEDLGFADLVLGSHDHADHIDRPAWPLIARAAPRAKFVVPELLRKRVASELGLESARVLGVDFRRGVKIGKMRITGIPAAHEFLDTDKATGLHPYLGFIVEAGGLTIYHAGDTCLHEQLWSMLRRWRIDLAFLPINGRDAKRLSANCIGNMTYQEAADLAGALKPGFTVPAHFEMFAMNSEDPQLFLDYMRVKYPDLAVLAPRHGEAFVVKRKKG